MFFLKNKWFENYLLQGKIKFAPYFIAYVIKISLLSKIELFED